MDDVLASLVGVSFWDRRHLGGLSFHHRVAAELAVRKKAGGTPAVPERNPIQRASRHDVRATPEENHPTKNPAALGAGRNSPL